MVSDNKLKDLSIQTDCKILIEYMNKEDATPMEISGVIKDILRLGRSFLYCKIQYVNRQTTLDAHKLVIKARINGFQVGS